MGPEDPILACHRILVEIMDFNSAKGAILGRVSGRIRSIGFMLEHPPSSSADKIAIPRTRLTPTHGVNFAAQLLAQASIVVSSLFQSGSIGVASFAMFFLHQKNITPHGLE